MENSPVAGFYGILLIIALVAVSGLIAYVGDILGRRMGRKRLSLFGLRPRHTAIAISVVAGMLITLFTLGAAMLVSRDVKDGFLSVDNMRRQQAELSRQVERLSGQIGDLEESLEGTQQQLANGKTELEETKRARGETLAELAEVKAELTKRKAELQQASQEVEQRERVAKRVLVELYQLQNRVDALRATATRAEQGYVLERALPILFGAQQSLDVQLVPSGQSVASARRRLDDMVARLGVATAAAGARPLPGTDDVVIISRPVRDPESDQVSLAGSEQVLSAVAASIHESPAGVIVRAYSTLNTHRGEPVYVDFQLFRNLLVFRQGEKLAETLIDGRLSEPALMGALVSLLRDEVGSKGREENVMPRLIPGGPNLFGSTGGSVGEMTYDELFAVIRELRRINGVARVMAVAAADTWTIGPLKVELKVAPVAVGS